MKTIDFINHPWPNACFHKTEVNNRDNDILLDFPQPVNNNFVTTRANGILMSNNNK